MIFRSFFSRVFRLLEVLYSVFDLGFFSVSAGFVLELLFVSVELALALEYSLSLLYLGLDTSVALSFSVRVVFSGGLFFRGFFRWVMLSALLNLLRMRLANFRGLDITAVWVVCERFERLFLTFFITSFLKLLMFARMLAFIFFSFCCMFRSTFLGCREGSFCSIFFRRRR